MPVLAMIIVGAAAGFFATRMMKMNSNVITTVSIGVLGAIIGGGVLRLILVVGGWMAGFVGAVLGALLLIWLWRTYGPTS
ncbi:MAG: GlsB/YeaQ/YmgE family stress response membrane protein [Paracoccaceae bacterium]